MNTTRFELSLDQLHDIASALKVKVAEGLRADGSEIACLPTHLGLPSGQEQGEALVVDTGGTNTRAARVILCSSGGTIVAGPCAQKVPDGREKPLSRDSFFNAQASMAASLGPIQDRLPLGYCFSYPAQATPDGDAILLRWTKGLKVEDTVDERVGIYLKDALIHHGINVGKIRVLNDTVASLLGGAHLLHQPRFGQNYIGLILGTGTNMAGVFAPQQLTKVKGLTTSMVVNLESGNFHPPFLTEFDDVLDAQSDNPRRQRLEKAIAGHYLPQLLTLVHPGALNPKEGAGQLVFLRDHGQDPIKTTAGQLLKRSAQIAAACLVGLSQLYPPGDTAVLGEGGLLWGDPSYANVLRQTMATLLPSRKIELIAQQENVNLLGAACAALSSS